MKPFSGSYPRPISLTFSHSSCSIPYHLSPFIPPYYPGLCFDYQTRQALACLWGLLPEMFSCSSRDIFVLQVLYSMSPLQRTCIDCPVWRSCPDPNSSFSWPHVLRAIITTAASVCFQCVCVFSCLVWKPQGEEALCLCSSLPQPVPGPSGSQYKFSEVSMEQRVNLQIALLRHTTGFYLEKCGAQVCAS